MEQLKKQLAIMLGCIWGAGLCLAGELIITPRSNVEITIPEAVRGKTALLRVRARLQLPAGNEAWGGYFLGMCLNGKELADLGGADVLLVGVPRPGLVLKTAPFYGRLAREFDLPYEGAVLKTILSSGPLKSDAIHPNRAGYRRLAEGLALRIRTR